MAWVATIESSVEEAELLTAGLWNEGTNGVAEVTSEHGVRLIAGFGTEAEAVRALSRLGVAGTIAPVDSSSWAPPPARSIEVGPHTLVIDAEHSFGHGEHPTTRLCLDLLTTHVLATDHVLDIGTGSGVLAVAASRLGAATATGIDRDPTVLETARSNNERNGTDASFSATLISEVGQSYPLVVANMLIADLAPIGHEVARVARGRVILSGFLTQQADGVARLLRRSGEPTWRELTRIDRDGWVGLVLER